MTYSCSVIKYRKVSCTVHSACTLVAYSSTCLRSNVLCTQVYYLTPSLSLSLSLLPFLIDDIEVLFYEEKNDNSLNPVQPWSAKGRFGPNDVHHQYAIVFQTPPFYNLAIERPVTVWIALRRPSDSELSEPKPFLYLPQEFGERCSFNICMYTCTIGRLNQ